MRRRDLMLASLAACAAAVSVSRVSGKPTLTPFLQASPLRGPGFPPLARRSVAGYGDCPSGTAPIPDAGCRRANGTPAFRINGVTVSGARHKFERLRCGAQLFPTEPALAITQSLFEKLHDVTHRERAQHIDARPRQERAHELE